MELSFLAVRAVDLNNQHAYAIITDQGQLLLSDTLVLNNGVTEGQVHNFDVTDATDTAPDKVQSFMSEMSTKMGADSAVRVITGTIFDIHRTGLRNFLSDIPHQQKLSDYRMEWLLFELHRSSDWQNTANQVIDLSFDAALPAIRDKFTDFMSKHTFPGNTDGFLGSNATEKL